MLIDLPYIQETDACFEEAVGAAGLSRATVDAMAPKLAAAVEHLRKLKTDGALPLLALPYRNDDRVAWTPIVDRYRSHFDDVVVLGTGGSSLGGATLCRLVDSGFTRRPGAPRVHFMDNIDPATFEAMFQGLDLARTGFLVISKSGGTAETLCQALVVMDRLAERLGRENLATRVTCITEKTDNALRKLAAAYGLFCLEHDPAVGGRFSVLSLTGLLPAAIAGVDVEAVRRGAATMLDATIAAEDPMQSAAGIGALINLGLNRERGISQTVLMPYVDRLSLLPFWYRQLWAESLGKDGHGTTPIDALGTVDQHSQLQLYLAGPRDKMFTVLMGDPKRKGPMVREEIAGPAADTLDYLIGRSMGDLLSAEQEATARTLIDNGCPTRIIRFGEVTEEVIGGLMMQFMIETILSAHMLGIDAFDQPAVEQGKILARQYLRESAG